MKTTGKMMANKTIQIPKRLPFSKNIVKFIFLLISITPVLAVDGASTLAATMQAENVLTYQNFEIEVPSPFALEELVNIQIEETRPNLVLISGPRLRRYTNSSNELRRAFSYTFMANQAGILQLPNFRVSSGSDSTLVRGARVIVLNYDESESSLPTILRWNDLPENLYVGQSIMISLAAENMQSMLSITPPPDPNIASALLENSSSAKIIRQDILGIEAYKIPIKTWVLTPTIAATINIPSIATTIGSLARRSAAKEISVLDVPEEAQKYGAVGNFSLSLKAPEKIIEGEEFYLVLQLEGSGNIHYLQLPVPQLNGRELESPEIIFATETTEQGYQGSKTLKYKVSFDQAGEYSSYLDSFTWWNPEKKIVQRLREQELTIRVEEQSAASLKYFYSQEELLDLSRISYFEYLQLFYKGAWLVLLLPALFLLIIISIQQKRQRGKIQRPAKILTSLILGTLIVFGCSNSLPEEEIAEAQRLYASKDYEKALAIYEVLQEKRPQNIGYLLNIAIINLKLERKSMSMWAVNQALVYLPGNSLLLDMHDYIYESLGFTSSKERNAAIYKLRNLLLIVIYILGYALVVILLFKHKLGGNKFLFYRNLIAGMFFILIFYQLIFSYYPSPRSAIVLAKGVTMQRIPEVNVEYKSKVLAGSSLKIKGESKNYYLVETDASEQGWVLKSNILVLKKSFF